MPPITWRNVDAPDFSPASKILDSAVGNFGDAFNGIADNLSNIRGRQKENRSAAAIPVLAGLKNGADVNSVLAQVGSMIKPEDMTPELQQALLSTRATGLGYDSTSIQNNNRQAENDRQQQTQDRTVLREDQIAALGPIYAAQREAAGALTPEFIRDMPGIHAGESGGNYDALYGNAQEPGGAFAGTRVSEMTVNEAIQFADPSGPYAKYVSNRNNGTVSTPMGGFQIVGTTLKDAAKGLGLTGNETMTRELQDQLGNWIHTNQGVGAWVGFKPGVQAPPSIADSLPEGSLLSPADLDMFYSGIQTARNNANTNATAADVNRERDTLFADGRVDRNRSDIANARGDVITGREQQEQDRAFELTQIQRDADTWAQENMNNFASDPGNMLTTTQSIMQDQSITSDQRRARVRAMQEVVSGSPGVYNGSGTDITPPSITSAMRQTMMVDRDFNSLTDPNLNGTDGLQVIRGASPEVLADVSGEGQTAAQKSETLLVGANALVSQGINQSPEEIAKIVAQVAETTGLNPALVMGLASQAINNDPGFFGTFGVEKTRLTSLVEKIGTRDAWQRLATRQQESNQRLEDFDSLVANEEAQMAILDQMSRLPGPKAAERKASAEKKLVTIRDQMKEIYERDGDANKGEARIASEQVEAAKLAADAANNVSPEAEKLIKDRAAAVEAGNTRSTQRGNTVNLEASAASQALTQIRRTNEIAAGLSSVQTSLATGGGSPLLRWAETIIDLTRSAKDASKNKEERALNKEALDWSKTDEARDIFVQYPMIIGPAKADPLRVYKQIKSGMTPEEIINGYQDDAEAQARELTQSVSQERRSPPPSPPGTPRPRVEAVSFGGGFRSQGDPRSTR